MVVVPGLVDAHRHVWQAPRRGVGADMTRPDYLAAVIGRGLPALTPDDLHRATLLGAAEALDAGITTVFDWNHATRGAELTDAVLDAYEKVGIRVVLAHAGPDDKEVRRLADLRGRITGALATLGPEHGPWDETVRQVELARDLGLIVSMHVGAGPDSPVWRLHDVGLLGPHVQLVHANQITLEGAALLADLGVNVVVTPVVEATMGHGVSAYSRLVSAGCRPGLGTDVVVNAPPDLFEPMRATLQQHRLSTGTMAAASEVLTAATEHGARAVGLGSAIGKVTVGGRGDLVLLKGLTHLTPAGLAGARLGGAVVTACRASDVDTVVVDGRVVKRAGRLVGLDLDRLRAETRVLAARIAA
jgi:cytosine/adenosine deaminase-related metal-dependent hydrolase